MQFIIKNSYFFILLVLIMSYSASTHADITLLSANQFILINKTGEDLYYSYKPQFNKGDGAGYLPQVMSLKDSNDHQLKEDEYLAIGKLPESGTFTLLVSTEPKGLGPVALYTFPNGQSRVFLQATVKEKVNPVITPLPNKQPTDTKGKNLCVNIPFVSKPAYYDADVITNKAKPTSNPGVCLNLDGNISPAKLSSTVIHPDQNGNYTDATIAKSVKNSIWYKI